MSILKYLREELSSPIIAYHGSNSSNITKFDVPTGTEKDGVLWFTDDASYARENGTYVYKVKLQPKKEVTPDAIKKITQDELYDAFVASKENLDRELFDKMYPKIIEGYTEFAEGDIPFYDIFGGWGDTVAILKNLGFDMYTHTNKYYGEERYFYLVLDDDIITLIDDGEE